MQWDEERRSDDRERGTELHRAIRGALASIGYCMKFEPPKLCTCQICCIPFIFAWKIPPQLASRWLDFKKRHGFDSCFRRPAATPGLNCLDQNGIYDPFSLSGKFCHPP